MPYYMIICHENHSGSAMGRNHTEDTVQRYKCSNENKYNYWKHNVHSQECTEDSVQLCIHYMSIQALESDQSLVISGQLLFDGPDLQLLQTRIFWKPPFKPPSNSLDLSQRLAWTLPKQVFPFAESRGGLDDDFGHNCSAANSSLSERALTFTS